MHKHRTAAILLALAMSASSLQARDAIRLDATSEATAQASFKQMIESADRSEQEALATAMLKINLAGVQSAYEVVQRPELQTLSIGRVKDQVAGMTAEEIVAYADTLDSPQPQPAAGR